MMSNQNMMANMGGPMYNMQPKKSNIGKIAILIVSLIILIASIRDISDQYKRSQDAIQVDAVVTQCEKIVNYSDEETDVTWRTQIKYQVNDEIFEDTMSYIRETNVGDIVKIYVSSKDPSESASSGVSSVSMFLLVVSAAVSLVTVLLIKFRI